MLLNVLLSMPGWLERFTHLTAGLEVPAAPNGWRHGAMGKTTDRPHPTWVSPDLRRAYYVVNKGNEYRIVGTDGTVWPANSADSFCGIHRAVDLIGQGPEGSLDWWCFNDLYRYLHPWTFENPPIQHKLYLSPGQLKYTLTGDIDEALTEGYSTTWPGAVNARC